MNPHLPPRHRQQPPSHNHPRYDRDGHIILTNPSAPTQVELYVDGMHLATKTINAQQTDTNTYFDHTDWLGTERARTDWVGNLCETVASLPFGDGETPSTTCSEGDVSPMHFTGKQRDIESGLDDFGARYDSSSFGRFMTPDWAASPTAVPYAAFGDPQTLNLYAYAVNAPVDRADSDGHCLIDFNCISTVYDTVPTSKNDNTTTTICSGPRCPSPSTSGATVTPDQQTNTQQAQQLKQGAKGGLKIALGVGLIATAAGGDLPGGALGAILVASAGIGGAATTVSGVVDVAGAASKTDVSQADEALDATGNLAGLVTTVVSGGNLKAGQTAATVSDVVTLAASPRDALRNAATLADAGRTSVGAHQLVHREWGNIKSAGANVLKTFLTMMATNPITPQ